MAAALANAIILLRLCCIIAESVHCKDGQQQEDRSNVGINKEFQRDTVFVPAAILCNYEIHWYKHYFPENIEKEEIPGEKNTE